MIAIISVLLVLSASMIVMRVAVRTLTPAEFQQQASED